MNVKPVDSSGEVEQDRQRRLAELNSEGPGWIDQNRPGSFGCHELLDRTSMVADLVEERVLSHPACVANRDWDEIAERAASALRGLYQRIEAEHV